MADRDFNRILRLLVIFQCEWIKPSNILSRQTEEPTVNHGQFYSLQLYLYGKRWTDPGLNRFWEMNNKMLHGNSPLDMQANEKALRTSSQNCLSCHFL